MAWPQSSPMGIHSVVFLYLSSMHHYHGFSPFYSWYSFAVFPWWICTSIASTFPYSYFNTNMRSIRPCFTWHKYWPYHIFLFTKAWQILWTVTADSYGTKQPVNIYWYGTSIYQIFSTSPYTKINVEKLRVWAWYWYQWSWTIQRLWRTTKNYLGSGFNTYLLHGSTWTPTIPTL